MIIFCEHFHCLQCLKPTVEAEITNIGSTDIKKDMISAFKKIAENREVIECKILMENLLEIQMALASYSGNLAANICLIGQLKRSNLIK